MLSNFKHTLEDGREVVIKDTYCDGALYPDDYRGRPVSAIAIDDDFQEEGEIFFKVFHNGNDITGDIDDVDSWNITKKAKELLLEEIEYD